MVAYRFCRPDDIPQLVAAVNRCYGVHFPDEPPLSVERFRREMQHLQLWPSNSMLARAGDEPIAVVLGTKRERAVMVRRIGVAPGHQRQGHGLHLLTSLSQKLAVLGPPRMVAEVPEERHAACAFFAAAGWRREASYRDWQRPAASPSRPPGEAVTAVTVAALDELGVLPAGDELAWERQAESLRGAADELCGLALLGGDSIAAWLLYRAPAGGGAEVAGWGSGAAGEPPPPAAVALLLAHVQRLVPGPQRLPAVGSGELPEALLAGLGFAPAGTAWRFATEAVPA